MKEALFYERSANLSVDCTLCPHRCKIFPQHKGICGVRENIGGRLYSLNYDKIVARHIDPIEKKPFFHVLPGSTSYSVSAMGCNLSCKNCQNHEISQVREAGFVIYGDTVTPAEIVESALRCESSTIAYTYTEPTIFYEFVLETAQLAVEAGLRNILVTNGFINPEPLRMLAPFIAAANVDLKGMTEEFYRSVCGGRLAPVLETIALMKKLGIWVEVTTLLIPGFNDDEATEREIIGFIKSIDPTMPWHVSAFHPEHKFLDVPRTPAREIEKVREIALAEGLDFVYTGNIGHDHGENTYCNHCGAMLAKRRLFDVLENNISRGLCPTCGGEIPGIWEK